MNNTLLFVIVEGYTEARFFKDVLVPHLRVCCNYSTTIQNLRGISKYEDLKEHISNEIDQGASQNIDSYYFTCMIDLYQLPKNFPKYEQAQKYEDKYERISVLETALEKDIRTKFSINFIPYIQLHEFEALLFTSPEKLAADFATGSNESTTKNAIKELQKMLQAAPGENPELINTDTGPSKHLDRIFSTNYGYKPMGAQTAKKIGLETLREKCRHFNEWVKILESLNKHK